jgi:hypothetical protein
MSLSLKCEGSFSSDGETMYFGDTTGTYNASTNVGGWGAPNVATTTVTSFQIKCNWVSAGTIVTYNFTVSAGTITVASVTDGEGTTANILADLASTSFPFDSPDLFDLTDTFNDAIVLPDLEDGQFILTYKVIGINGGDAYTYPTSTTFFRTSSLCCCLQELRLEADPNCECSSDVISRANRVDFWLKAALCAVDAGKSNETALAYFTKAQEVCDGCGG